MLRVSANYAIVEHSSLCLYYSIITLKNIMLVPLTLLILWPIIAKKREIYLIQIIFIMKLVT